MSVRVRYAPSPTGKQHIGGLRTALFNYFFARTKKGTFILRIEDTDRDRYSEDALEDIYQTFKWLGIKWDEGPDIGGPFGPYIQSERIGLYKKYAELLLAQGKAYRCFCSPERLDQIRKEQIANKETIVGYDRKCRSLTTQEEEELLKNNNKFVIRFKIPIEGKTCFHDELLGDIEKQNIDINPDPVLIKSDGFPTYHLANIVDDHLMQITHVLRSQEWLSSGPLHILLYQAFGWQPPLFYHLPMVLGEDGQKLSKRHGSTAVTEFRAKGYLPEAIINYVTLLGWSYDANREFFNKAELEELFTLDKLNKASAIFNYKKLDWFNGNYIRLLSPQDLAERIMPWLIQANLLSVPVKEAKRSLLQKIVPLIQERLTFLSEAPKWCAFFFEDIKLQTPEELIPNKLERDQTIIILKELKNLLNNFKIQSDAELEDSLKKLALELNLKLGDLLYPLRIAVTGSKVSPPLLESMRILGEEIVFQRIDSAIALLEKKEKIS